MKLIKVNIPMPFFNLGLAQKNYAKKSKLKISLSLIHYKKQIKNLHIIILKN